MKMIKKTSIFVLLASLVLAGFGILPNTTNAQYYPSGFCYNWQNDLQVGSSGAAVEALHTALAREGFSRSNSSYVSTQTFNEETASLVTAFQEKYRSEILSPVGYRSGTGFVGAYTRAKLNNLFSCNGNNGNNNGQAPVITNLSAPTTLRTNESGTWTLTASDPQNGTLYYAVRWGDEYNFMNDYNSVTPAYNSYVQQAIFNHTYTVPGTYTVSFRVRDNQGYETYSSATVTVTNNGTGNDNSGLAVSISPTKTTYTQDEVITFTLTARNNTAYEKVLTFPSGCQTSYRIGSFDSSSNQVCTAIYGTVRIPAYSYQNWTVSHYPSTYRLSTGTHTLTGRISGYGEASTNISITGYGNGGTSGTNAPRVISPNGGESWQRGTYQTLQWQMPNVNYFQAQAVDVKFISQNSGYPYYGNNGYNNGYYGSTCPVGQTCAVGSGSSYGYGSSYYPYTPSYGNGQTYTILSNSLLTSFNWYVGSTPNSWYGIPAGTYQMQVCLTGSNICDTSDGYVTLY
jgi:hypothetical protein